MTYSHGLNRVLKFEFEIKLRDLDLGLGQLWQGCLIGMVDYNQVQPWVDGYLEVVDDCDLASLSDWQDLRELADCVTLVF